ncbi:NAD-binding protein [Campylobacter concisus]|jgi:trkA-N|uniref:NAD-binding protein n=1 Tax=Campylobacter concisus TaxID=199 RepID=UPI000CD9ABB9|nr:NAD-binding protein [Campylobacter concisus]
MKFDLKRYYRSFIYSNLNDTTMLICGILTVFFSFLGHSIENGFFSGFLKSAYQTLALLLGNYDFKATNIVSKCSLYIAIVFTLFFYCSVFIKLLGKKLRTWCFLKFFAKNHIVICGAGDMGYALAKDILNKHQDKKLLVMDINPTNDNVNSICTLGGYAISGNAIDKDVLNKLNIAKAEKIILMTGKDISNLEILDAITKVIPEVDKNDPDNKKNVYIHLESKENYEILPSIKRSSINIKAFSVYDNAAQTLFMKHPLGENVDTIDNDSVNLAIVGFDAAGLSVLYRALTLGHFFNGKPLNVTIFDNNHEKKRAEFLKLYPISLKAGGIINWNIDFKDDGELFNKDGIENFTQIIFCKTNVQASLTDIARIIKNQSAHLKNKQFFIFIDKHDGIKGIANDIKIEDTDVIPFGDFSQICSYDVVVNEIYDKMAIRADQRYNELHDPGTKHETKWDTLSPFLQDSNRMQVEHLPIKLKAINKLLSENRFLEYDEAKEKAQDKWFDLMLNGQKISDIKKIKLWDEIKGAKILATYISLDDIEKLAKMEKHRWNAFHILNGWTTLPKPEGQDYPRRKDDNKKEHALLIGWDELEEASKYIKVETGKKPHNYKSDDVETVMRAYDMIVSAFEDDKILQDESSIYCKEIFEFKRKIDRIKNK